MNGRRKRTESEERALASPIDMKELLERLNDREEQRMAYPAIDDYEEQIDLIGTDILHGWRDGEPGAEDELFAHAFANAFRVLVLSEGQQVIRRNGSDGDRWLWEHTGHIAGWTVASYAGDDPVEQAQEHDKTVASYYGADRERWFATASEAAGGASEMVSVAGEHCRKARVVVRGIEVCSIGGASDALLERTSSERVVATRGNS